MPAFRKVDPTVLVGKCAQKRVAVGGCIARQRFRGRGSRCQRCSFDGHPDPSPARLACTQRPRSAGIQEFYTILSTTTKTTDLHGKAYNVTACALFTFHLIFLHFVTDSSCHFTDIQQAHPPRRPRSPPKPTTTTTTTITTTAAATTTTTQPQSRPSSRLASSCV
jgi:hypothetical protein